MFDFAKKVTDRVKTFKCSQPYCLSDNEDNLQIIVYGDIQCDRKGFMCTSCFVQGNIIPLLKKVEFNVLPIRKFMQKLHQFYASYKKQKESETWQPNINEKLKKDIRSAVAANDAELTKRIAEVLVVVQREVDNAVAEARINNTDKDFEKILEFLGNDRKVDIRDSLMNLSKRIVKVGNDYSYAGEELVKQGNQRIAERITSIIKIAEDTIQKLIELQTKQLHVL